jgi:hypothetical protein
MRSIRSFVWLLAVAALLVAWPNVARAESHLEIVTGKAFDNAVPKDFYLEGNAIPTEKGQATLLKTPSGARVLFALINTTGYSTRIQQKYIGMIITETKISVCGISLPVGSYGFGLDRPAPPSDADAKFHVYNQAGEKVGECASKKDAGIKPATPLQVIVRKGAPARLCLGLYPLVVE